MIPSRLAEYEQKLARSQDILSYLNQHLADQSFLLGDAVSLADISVYAYTHLAGEGGLELIEYKHLQAWFKSVSRLDGFVAM